ncbi:hypothetical protein N9B83_03205 [Schleiferiaceae bacterium]|nr:hypothetical protein [Schleiferiaceae bacterium]
MIQRRITSVLGIGLAVALILSFSFWRLWKTEKDNYQRVFKAGEALGQELTTLRLENGQLAAQNQVLQLKSKELSALLPELAAEVRGLNVRLAKAQSVSATGFTVQTPATVLLRDSVIYDTVQVRTFDYQDGFFTVKGKAVANQQHLELSYQDTLVQVVYRGERERPWLWIFSPRKLMQRVSLKNPNAHIHYTQHIEIIH